MRGAGACSNAITSVSEIAFSELRGYLRVPAQSFCMAWARSLLTEWPAEAPMAAQYSEEDLRQAFLCGVSEGAQHGNANADEAFTSSDTAWIDALFYHGFSNQELFSRPGYSTPPQRRMAATAGE